jgi:uncharacterized OB-fold protein
VSDERSARKALPIVDVATKPYWDGAVRGELLLPRCQCCGAYRQPASETCPRCLSTESVWTAASGRGTIYSFAIVRQALDEAWAADVPYCVAIVALEEGPHLLTNVTGIEVEAVTVGLAVQVFFDRVSEEIALPKFRPVAVGDDAENRSGAGK